MSAGFMCDNYRNIRFTGAVCRNSVSCSNLFYQSKTRWTHLFVILLKRSVIAGGVGLNLFILRKYHFWTCTWLKTGTSGGLLWMCWWTFGFCTMLGIFWISWVAVSLSLKSEVFVQSTVSHRDTKVGTRVWQHVSSPKQPGWVTLYCAWCCTCRESIF